MSIIVLKNGGTDYYGYTVDEIHIEFVMSV